MASRAGRAAERAFERTAQNALLCKVPITEWLAMSREKRKRLITRAKREAKA